MKRNKRAAQLLIILLVFVLSAGNVFGATKGKYKLPSKVVRYTEENGKWRKIEVNKYKFNKYGDIITVSDHAGKAKTSYYKGTHQRKSVTWTGRGYDSIQILTYDKKGHLLNCYDSFFSSPNTKIRYKKGWISKVGTAKVKCSFYKNGMIKRSRYRNVISEFNKKGLIKRVLCPYLSIGHEYLIKYNYDKKGNVKTVLVTIKDLGGTTWKDKYVFSYGKKNRVSRRTQSAWINEICKGEPGANVVFQDIVAFGVS